MAKEDCADLLQREHLPADEKALYGLPTRAEFAQARQTAKPLYGQTLATDQLPPAIARLFALTPASGGRWRFLQPLAAPGATSTSPVLLTLDRDGDGLPDDVETRLGTDPQAADSDHDGYSDASEAKNGYAPLGPGALGKPLRGLDKALVDGRPIEEPRSLQADVDAGFTVEVASIGMGPATRTRFAGKAAPNSVAALFVYSDVPFMASALTSADGNWSYDFSGKLSDGRHQAYVAINDDAGKLVAASSPTPFYVKDARVVSEADFLRPDAAAPAASGSDVRAFWWAIGGAGLVLVIVVILLIRAMRKRPAKAAPSEESYENP